MGFDDLLSVGRALIEADYDVERAVVALSSESFVAPTLKQRTAFEKRKKKKETATTLFQAVMEVLGTTATTTTTFKLVPSMLNNFLVTSLEFLAHRLCSFNRFCISCHAPHNCLSSQAVVCASALCVFRWDEFHLDSIMPCSLCTFEDCGHADLPARVFAFFGRSMGELCAEFDVSAQLITEMASHKYLPGDEMMKLFTAMRAIKGSKVVNIANPALCLRFERKRLDMEKKGLKGDLVKPHVAYHGTAEANIEKICKTGFLLSKLASNTGNRGLYGAGIYCSPNASISLGYSRGGNQVLVCAVLMGRRYNKAGLGSSLQPGYDSHTDPTGMAEWVIFDEAAILPCFLIQVKRI